MQITDKQIYEIAEGILALSESVTPVKSSGFEGRELTDPRCDELSRYSRESDDWRPEDHFAPETFSERADLSADEEIMGLCDDEELSVLMR